MNKPVYLGLSLLNTSPSIASIVLFLSKSFLWHWELAFPLPFNFFIWMNGFAASLSPRQSTFYCHTLQYVIPAPFIKKYK